MIPHLQLLFYDISVEWELNLFNKGNIDLCSAIFYQIPEQGQLPYRNLNILYQYQLLYQPNL